jgi:hypothetical protein
MKKHVWHIFKNIFNDYDFFIEKKKQKDKLKNRELFIFNIKRYFIGVQNIFDYDILEKQFKDFCLSSQELIARGYDAESKKEKSLCYYEYITYCKIKIKIMDVSGNEHTFFIE